MILVWALLYFPSAGPGGESYDVTTARLENDIASERHDRDRLEKELNSMYSAWKGQSYLGRIGKMLEPIVEPLGVDRRIGMAAVASFPAREVMVGTLGIIFNQGQGDAGADDYRSRLGKHLTNQTWTTIPAGRCSRYR